MLRIATKSSTCFSAIHSMRSFVSPFAKPVVDMITKNLVLSSAAKPERWSWRLAAGSVDHAWKAED